MKLFVDCGTHLGDGLKQHIALLGIDETWLIDSFEANPYTFQYLASALDRTLAIPGFEFFAFPRLRLINKAVWVRSGSLSFYCASPNKLEDTSVEIQNYYDDHSRRVERGEFLITHEQTGLPIDGGSSIYGKRMKKSLRRIGNEIQRNLNWETQIKVECIDFSSYIDLMAKDVDYIYCKMDLEGAEFRILWRLIYTGSIRKIDGISIEWHHYGHPIRKIVKVFLKICIRMNSVKIVDWH
jgi:hypothetical protein